VSGRNDARRPAPARAALQGVFISIDEVLQKVHGAIKVMAQRIEVV